MEKVTVTGDPGIPVPVNYYRQENLKLCGNIQLGKHFFAPQFNRDMDTIFNAGDKRIERAEFEALMDAKISDEFWAKFTNGKGYIETEEGFFKYLENCQESLQMTGDVFVSIARSKNIANFDPAQLGPLMKGMKVHSYFERSVKMGAIMGGQPADTKLEDFNDKSREYLGGLLFTQFMVSGAWKELGIFEVKNMDITDPWVAARFRPMFQNYVENDAPPTREGIKQLVQFQKDVKDFRDWAAANRVGEQVKLADLNDQAIDKIMSQYTKGKAWVIEQLDMVKHPENRASIAVPGRK